MPGTFFGLELGRRGVMTHKRALDVTGHNLANASTEGYSRQEAVFTVTDPYSRPDFDSAANPGQLGSGVKTGMIRRIRNEYMDPYFRRSNTDRYYWEDQVNVFKRVESSFAEPASAGIASQLTEFFKSWQNLNNSPQDPGVKSSVKEIGIQLAALMNSTYSQLNIVQESIIKPGTLPAVAGGQITEQVNRVNELLGKIQDVTDSIMKVYRINQQPNDLMDQRDLLLDELSRYGPLTVNHKTVDGKPTGEITMSFFGANINTVPAARVTFSLRINDQPGPDYGNLELHETNLGRVIDLTAEKDNTTKGGSILGLERSRQSITSFKQVLNDISVNIRDKIRAKNALVPPASILDFFLGSLETGDFRVNPAVVSDPGNAIVGTKANLIADIRAEDMDSARSYTLEECFSILATEVGSRAKGTDDMAASHQSIQEQMNELRESVAGVSVDEEMTRMVQFQYGFQASARVVSMVDELLDVIINRMKA